MEQAGKWQADPGAGGGRLSSLREAAQSFEHSPRGVFAKWIERPLHFEVGLGAMDGESNKRTALHSCGGKKFGGRRRGRARVDGQRRLRCQRSPLLALEPALDTSAGP